MYYIKLHPDCFRQQSLVNREQSSRRRDKSNEKIDHSSNQLISIDSSLEERTIIYQPNTVKGNKPINIGHSYSVLTALPEREETGDIPWAIPLTVERVKSSATGKQVGSQQQSADFEQ